MNALIVVWAMLALLSFGCLLERLGVGERGDD